MGQVSSEVDGAEGAGPRGLQVLVLGGTGWLGGHIASTALALGHRVTCLARGLSGPAPKGVAWVQEDRDEPDAYRLISAAQWDAVIDVSRQPGQVRGAAQALVGRAGVFVFVSSGNVYADHSYLGQDETGSLLPPLEGDVMETMASYGEAKVACENHVLAAFGPERALIARAGLIGGPGDTSDRSGYWPWRFARPATPDGSVLVPDAPGLATQLIDVRDLAQWLVQAASQGVRGIFNASGDTMLLPAHLAVARRVAGHQGPVVAASEDWLIAQGVEQWMGERSLPLWVADEDWVGFNSRDASKAREAGLVTRPLEETLADTLEWEINRYRYVRRKAGLSDDDQWALLEQLAAERAGGLNPPSGDGPA